MLVGDNVVDADTGFDMSVVEFVGNSAVDTETVGDF